jgi:asparagine synthase (glutamine-hydrolysing)
MCGITGFWNYGSGRPANPAVLRAMTASLVHRGPDEDGCWIDGTVALGVRRLQVIDPSGGHQPMTNEDGSVHVVYNGEIYNHVELRRELESLGHRFRTRSDTEVIAHAFEEWGSSCARRFDGMFAYAVWDARRRVLCLTRDQLGIKPLYVYEGPEGIVFGSELKAVLAAPWVPVVWDLEAVDDFLTYEYVPAPRTIVADVRKMLPGTTLVCRVGRGGTRAESYWQLEAAGNAPGSVADAAAGLRDRLERSVKRRVVADVPVGVFLSGGIDSSIVVSRMAGAGSGPVRSFSLGFAERSYNELAYAREAARAFGTLHREETVTPTVVDLAERLADSFDEPFADVSTFPTYLVSALAREEVTVALSGDGGDELFAGYDHYRAHRWADRLRRLTRTAPWGAADRLLAWIPPTAAKKGLINKAKRFAAGLRRPGDLEHARWWVFWDLAERRALYDGGLAHALDGRDCFAHYRGRLAEARERGFRGLQAQLFSDVTGYLADDILVKLDRASMAVSLEARVPFLAPEVVEYAMSIPDGWKLQNGVSKWILREAFRDELPPRIRLRGKEGFSIPMKNWLRGPLRPMLLETLAPERVRQRGWFDSREVARLLTKHVSGRENHAHRLWCLMSLELSLAALTRRVKERVTAPQKVGAG